MQLNTFPFSSIAFALTDALKKVRDINDNTIVIPYGEYHIYAEEAASLPLCVSNHGYNGFKRAALCIENFEGLCVDGSNSTFILHGCMDFAIINRSSNIEIKNLSVKCADTCNFQGKVLEASNEKVVIRLEEHARLYQFGDKLFQKFEQEYNEMGRTIDYITESKEIRPNTGDENFGKPFSDIKKILDGDVLTLFDVPVAPPIGDTIVFTMSRRCNQAFLNVKSKNITFSNITVNTCWGMAFISQKCENITIQKCKVTPDEGRYWSAGQDGTHFVNCRGLIHIHNNLFENQLDDAVNLHGIYTKVEKVAKNTVLVRYSHFQSVGIDIYEKGDKIQFMYQNNQMPVSFAEIEQVNVLSLNYTALTLKNINGEICEGMICESISDAADAKIENNIFRNNRARGMLIASRGHIEIKNNHFHSGGAAIQFESDPFRWYESGGTLDVLIEGNLFDNCRHGKWGRAVIDINKRKEIIDGFYYHKKIEIKNNRFTQKDVPCVAADNVESLIFKGNTYDLQEPIVFNHANIYTE